MDITGFLTSLANHIGDIYGSFHQMIGTSGTVAFTMILIAVRLRGWWIRVSR